MRSEAWDAEISELKQQLTARSIRQIMPPVVGLAGVRSHSFICQPTVVFRHSLAVLLGGFDRHWRTAFDFDHWLRTIASTRHDNLLPSGCTLMFWNCSSASLPTSVTIFNACPPLDHGWRPPSLLCFTATDCSIPSRSKPQGRRPSPTVG